MKRVAQTRLLHGAPPRETICEVDLCEVGADRFVVNVRQGPRGGVLRDGVKTVAPVSRAEAERVMAATLAEKRQQGYRPFDAAQPAPIVAAAVRPPRMLDVRAQRVLQRLAQGEVGGARWPLDRAIWRAGELALHEAEPHLLALLRGATDAKGLRAYSIAWALGRLGSPAAIDTLAALRVDPRQPGHVQRIATLALLALSDEPTRAEFAAHMLAYLPDALRRAHARGAESFAEVLAEHLATDPNAFAVMDLLYLIDDAVVRPALLVELARAPLGSPTFYWIRHILKAAEYRRDAEVFALLAVRFEKVRASTRVWNQPHAYGSTTREYLRRRCWRVLRRLGALDDAHFVPMATAVLLGFDDGDATRPRGPYDAYAPYRLLNHLLYARSPRYYLPRYRKAFRLCVGARPGQPAPAQHEEAFPALWQARPETLLRLALESRCAPVHEMVARALGACPVFVASLSEADLIGLLGRPYAPTVRLAFEEVRRRHTPASPALLLALASCSEAEARQQARTWIDLRRWELLSETLLLAGLVAAPHADTRSFARAWLQTSSLAPQDGAVLLGRLFGRLLALPDDENSAALALDVAETFTLALHHYLGHADAAALRDLLGHPLEGVQRVGAELLSRLDSRSGLVPVELLLAVLRSAHASVRAVGMRLLGELSDEALALNFKLLVHLSVDKNADLRSASRSLLARVASAHADIALALAEGLVDALARRKLPDGAAEHVLSLFSTELTALLPAISRDRTVRLLRSGSPQAQQLGAALLASVAADELPLHEWVRLGSHQALAVRQLCWKVFEANRPWVRAELAEAARLCDAQWQDTRNFAAEYFRSLPAEWFDAEVLVSVIDSVKEDVQAFGRELAARVFDDAFGPTLLLQLSEHPARSVQLFTTHYLERYASGRLERVQALLPYFTSVLSRVNQGRVAKSRVLTFLQQEGLRSAEGAAAVTGLLHRLSATIAVEDRARAIEAMLSIARAHPSLPTPLDLLADPVCDRSAEEAR